MSTCSIKFCGKNSRTSNYTKDGITFHRFPNDPTRNEVWSRIIRIQRKDPYFKPHKDARICSVHFCDEDVDISKTGLKRLKASATPRFEIEVESEAEMGRRSKAAEAVRKRRADMTEEQRQEVAEKMAASQAARAATETPEQKEMRLSKQRKTSRSRYRNKRAAEDAARRKEVFDKLAAEGGLPERREKRARKIEEQAEKKYPVRYYRRLAQEGQLLVPGHSVALDEPGPSYRNDSSDDDQDMEDDDERFGAIIAAELRSIDDPEEKETVIAAIKKVLHESRVRRRQKKQTEIEFQRESEYKPVVNFPQPIDDRTEEEKAVSSIKSEPDEPIDSEFPPTDEPIPNLACQPETPIPMPMDDRTEEQIAVAAIKEEPIDSSYLVDSSSTFSHPEPDPLCDPAAPQPKEDITDADAAVAAVKQEPVETYEITISDVNMGDV